MKVAHLLFEGADVKAELSRIMKTPVDAILKDSTHMEKGGKFGSWYDGYQVYNVYAWLPELMTFDELKFFASMLQKAIKKVLPEFTEFMTREAMVYNSATQGWAINHHGDYQAWEDEIKKMMGKRRAGTGWQVQWSVRKPR